MNSYYKMNRDYREAYLLAKAKNIHKPKSNPHQEDSGEEASAWDKEMEFMHFSDKYPKNINYRDFMMYMLYPTFTYQDSYPVQASKLSWKRVFWRFSLLFFAGVSPLRFCWKI